MAARLPPSPVRVASEGRRLGRVTWQVPPHNKSTSFIMPAVNALVELTEPPWFVCPLNDIEIAHFERVVMGLKNFDMVLVLKDFSQKPVQVSAINVQHLDALKTWLDSCNVKFYEGPANLN